MAISISRLLNEYSLEEISKMTKKEMARICNSYDGITFLGEVNGTDFITYENLASEIGENIGEPIEPADIKTGGNWLEFTDRKYTLNCKTRHFLLAKNPVTCNVSYLDLFEAGCVYGLDSVFKNGKVRKLANISNKYKAKFIEINGKKYIVRLLKGKTSFNPSSKKNIVLDDWFCRGSEWNRVMLPVIKAYRYGKNSYNEGVYLEWQLSNGNGEDFATRNYDIEFAKYNWFSDLNVYSEEEDVYLGIKNWCEETANSALNRAIRGIEDKSIGAVSSGYGGHILRAKDVGFRPVLELVN